MLGHPAQATTPLPHGRRPLSVEDGAEKPFQVPVGLVGFLIAARSRACLAPLLVSVFAMVGERAPDTRRIATGFGSNVCPQRGEEEYGVGSRLTSDTSFKSGSRRQVRDPRPQVERLAGNGSWPHPQIPLKDRVGMVRAPGPSHPLWSPKGARHSRWTLSLKCQRMLAINRFPRDLSPFRMPHRRARARATGEAEGGSLAEPWLWLSFSCFLEIDWLMPT